MKNWLTFFVVCLLHVTTFALESTDPPPEATLKLLNRDIVTLRANLAGAGPEVRVERAKARFREITAREANEPIKTLAFMLEETKGVQFLIGDRFLFSVLEEDVDQERKQSFHDLIKGTEANLNELSQAWREMRDSSLLLRGVWHTMVATALLALLIWVVYFLSRHAVKKAETLRDRLAARYSYVDWREFLARLSVGIMKLVQGLVLFVLVYAWLHFVLSSFVVTEPLALGLGRWIWHKFNWVINGLISSLPDLVTILIILVLTRTLADLLNYFFDAIHQGRLQVPFLHPETTSATRRIVIFLTWGLGIAIAYPYLPGSSSEAFKGLSVLFGLMITLGSTGLVTQAMSGLVVIYARALRKGDFVDINGVQGVVAEVATLATKITTVRNEEITIPNAVLIATPIHNYSKLGDTQGTLLTTKVTIGYDTPWRQVHALLINAAKKTPGLRVTPAPFVYQRSLSDFYVEYELFANIDRPLERIPILSALHANIQDEFNEFGVQIMSPHFLSQPAQTVVVPKSQWHAAPADRPNPEKP